MTTQLDLFAESEQLERDRLYETAPTLFADTTVGYFHRQAAYATWCATYGNFDSLRRSHAWTDWQAPNTVIPTEQCRPASLRASMHCRHYGPDEDCQCVGNGGGVSRGACLHCTWEGPMRSDRNAAVEDAHDHCWPGWRNLPTVARVPDSTGGAAGRKRIATWIAHVNAIYPTGWLEAGGPIITRRGEIGHRHVERRTPFGGYDLALEGIETEAPGDVGGVV